MQRVFSYIREHNMIKEQDRVMVGISGGADSVCLLFVLKKYQQELPFFLEAVHIEHGIRGKESLEDAAFVENLCRQWQIPLHLYSYDVPALAKEWKVSMEEAARKARYEAFQRAAEEAQGTVTAVAHNQNDQAETLLFHLARGSGLKGLSGMQPVREGLIRPLLCLSREEIEGLLAKEGISYRTDSTNLQREYTRNKLRLEILPEFTREINAKSALHMAQAAEHIRKAQAYLEKQAGELAKKYTIQQNGACLVDRGALCREEEIMQEYVLRLCLERLSEGLKDLGAVHLEALRSLLEAQSGRGVDLPGGLRGENDQKWLRIYKKTQEPEPAFLNEPLLIPGLVHVPGYIVQTELLEVLPGKKQNIPEKTYTKCFDYDKMKHTVRLRNRQAGDYLVINAAGGRKKLKDYLIAEKIPKRERSQMLLLADGQEIVWAVGRRISETYKVTEHTKKILKIQIMEE